MYITIMTILRVLEIKFLSNNLIMQIWKYCSDFLYLIKNINKTSYCTLEHFVYRVQIPKLLFLIFK